MDSAIMIRRRFIIIEISNVEPCVVRFASFINQKSYETVLFLQARRNLTFLETRFASTASEHEFRV